MHSRVALSLLEALRNQDLPDEVLDDENVTLTLPRRLGLSGVVDSQIRRYRDDARRRRRVPDHEVENLMRLVVKRPDSEEVFLRVGADLHSGPQEPRWRRWIPRRVARALALRRIRQRLRTLFGRYVVTAASGSPPLLMAIDDIFLRGDEGGDACGIVTGLARVEIRRTGGEPERFVHLACLARGDERCVWGFRSAEDHAR